jgi:hypothetical protein
VANGVRLEMATLNAFLVTGGAFNTLDVQLYLGKTESKRNKFMKEKRSCGYPQCKNIPESRGKRKDGLGHKRHKWCAYHRKGKGKKERLIYSNSI